METLQVLIVDDEPGMCRGVQRALRGFSFNVPDAETLVDFEVATAGTGEEAMKLIDSDPPDVLLLDHKLPGMSGLDLLGKIAPRNLDTLTIMITAYASIETAVQATKQGAYDFLPKPFTPAELKYTVQKAGTRLILARRARALAEEKRKVRFEFTRVLGHELKAPIGAVESYLDILQSHTLGEEIGAYQEMIERAALRLKQMRTLIVDLLDMTRLESGQKARELVDLDLREVAAGCVEMHEVTAKERGITIELLGDENVPMRGDRAELEMIFNNLISNAVKYNRDDGRVTVTVTGGEQTAQIVVADTGIGMTKEECGKLFQEFVRIRSKKTKHVLGTGLGLSILKRLIQLYEGEVSVDSEPDVGTTFSVTIHPAAAAEKNDEQAPAEPSPAEG